jgi:zinc and cadmium transporter
LNSRVQVNRVSPVGKAAESSTIRFYLSNPSQQAIRIRTTTADHLHLGLPPPSYLWVLLFGATATATAGILVGVFVSASRRHVRIVIPLSAGLLLGVALFGLLPELAQDLTWALSLICFAVGFLLLTLLDRVGISICPDCSHDHDHHGCPAPLHGFAVPLLIAAGAHSLFDGWAIAASSVDSVTAVKIALPLALVLHKLPEGLSLGAILNHSLRSRRRAVLLAIFAELLTIAGGAVSLVLAPRVGSAWTSYPLALAGGFFLFLAYHALRAEWKKNRRLAVIAGLAGLAFSAILQTGLRSYFGG